MVPSQLLNAAFPLLCTAHRCSSSLFEQFVQGVPPSSLLTSNSTLWLLLELTQQAAIDVLSRVLLTDIRDPVKFTVSVLMSFTD